MRGQDAYDLEPAEPPRAQWRIPVVIAVSVLALGGLFYHFVTGYDEPRPSPTPTTSPTPTPAPSPTPTPTTSSAQTPTVDARSKPADRSSPTNAGPRARSGRCRTGTTKTQSRDTNLMTLGGLCNGHDPGVPTVIRFAAQLREAPNFCVPFSLPDKTNCCCQAE